MVEGVYARYCTAILTRFPASVERFRARERRNRAAAAAAAAAARDAERRYESAREESVVAASDLARMRKECETAKRQREAQTKLVEQREFRAAMADLAMSFRLDEVFRVATVTAILVAMVVSVPLGLAVSSRSPSLTALAIALVIGAPVTTFAFLASYPEIAARRLRALTVGKAPEAVNYLAMALRLNPSLDRAIAFAAASADEPVASRLRKVLWNVLMRSPPGVEDAFLEFARDWTQGDEELKQSLFTLRASSLERSDETREAALDKARDVAFSGTQRRMRDYADSLRAPTTALFALGVLLPMMIGAMLPLLSLGGLGSGTVGTGGMAGPDPWLTVIALDVAFPAALAGFAWHVLGRRPGTLAAPEVGPTMASRRVSVGVAAICGLVGVGLALLPLGPLAPLLPAFALASSLATFLLLQYRGPKRERDAVKRLEREVPDALFLLGNRIAEGQPLETALVSVADSMAGSPASAFFRRIEQALRLSHGSVGDILFGGEGVVATVPSRAVRGAMRLVVEASGKDPIGAGRAIVDLSNHLRELLHLDREVRRELGSVVDAMRSTAMFFGPLVLGVTAGMYVLLARAFAGIVSFSLSPSLFIAAVGVYLMFAVVAIVYFTTGIEHGPDPIEFRFALGKALPVAVGTFAAAVLVSAFALAF